MPKQELMDEQKTAAASPPVSDSADRAAYSLFAVIPKERSCHEAGVPWVRTDEADWGKGGEPLQQYCPLSEDRPVPEEQLGRYQAMAQGCVRRLNNITAPAAHLCSRLRLQKV